MITQSTKIFEGNSLFRYTVLALGVCVLFLAQTVLTWKETSYVDARGKIDSVNLEIVKLAKFAEDETESSKKKKLIREIDELKESDLVKATEEAANEEVDSKEGIWFWSLVRLKGLVICILGLLVIAMTGGAHEKLGSLVAIGVLIARI